MAEQRKLIKLGNSSFAIALPKDWIDKSGLKKGDDIFIERNQNGELIVMPQFKRRNGSQESFINVDGKEIEEIAREMISAYISGSDSITLSGDKTQLKIAKEAAKSFVSLEPTDEKDGKLILKDLVDINSINIETFVRRMDNDIKEMFSIMTDILDKKKKVKDCLKELEDIDKDVTKFYFLIWRFMNVGINNPGIQSDLKMDPKKFVSVFWVAYHIESIGDDIKRIARKLKTGDFQALKNAFLITKENYDKSMKSFFEKNKELSKEVILKKGELIKLNEKLSSIEGLEAISEKLNQINTAIHSNSKMMFYNL